MWNELSHAWHRDVAPRTLASNAVCVGRCACGLVFSLHVCRLRGGGISASHSAGLVGVGGAHSRGVLALPGSGALTSAGGRPTAAGHGVGMSTAPARGRRLSTSCALSTPGGMSCVHPRLMLGPAWCSRRDDHEQLGVARFVPRIFGGAADCWPYRSVVPRVPRA